jgi:hypothetical protein
MKKFLALVITLLLFPTSIFAKADSSSSQSQIWEVRSVDTMKTSRDLAREKLNDLEYDSVIKHDLQLIKDLGANYVAIDTPYDDEFMPYLIRWVKYAREAGLHVWFRGNFSHWEGWFGYEKNMTTQEHIRETARFIANNPALFNDGDAFDPCPECENAQWWPQPEKNKEYNDFLVNQQVNLKASFSKINKKVHTNWTGIIGGRAKEVLTADTVKSLDNLVAIDHYTNSLSNMDSYIDYFAGTFGAKTLVSEFGAPIPDIHGKMTDLQQADFIDSMMKVFYLHKENIYGLNYFALGTGTTEIIDKRGLPKLAYHTIKKYYSPAQLSGTITDELGKKLTNITVAANGDANHVLTGHDGQYSIVVPAESVEIVVASPHHLKQVFQIEPTYSAKLTQDLVLIPSKPNILYLFKRWLKSKFV